jgi:hypothetical protein
MSTRINWSKDGTQAYSYSIGSNTKSALSSAQSQILDGDIYKDAAVGIGDGMGCELMLNFPDTLSINKIGIKHNYNNSTVRLFVSSNSLDGIDGTWTEVINGTYTNSTVYQEFSCDSTSCTWARIRISSGGYPGTYCAFVFGDYQAAAFEYWDSTAVAKLSVDYPFTFVDAPNNFDYSHRTQFTIKNTDSSAHTYTINITPVRYQGDSFITNYFTLSKDGGTTKNTTITTASVAADTCSEVIDIWAIFTKAQNLADGFHYFSIQAMEAS